MISLVWKYLKQQKKRTILTILGVVLACALIASFGIFFSSFQGMMVKDAAVRTGTQDFSLFGFSAGESLSLQDARKIADNYLVKDSALGTCNQLFFFEKDGQERQVNLEEREEKALQMKDYQMVEGRLPKTSNEIMISSEGLNGLRVGEKITGGVYRYEYKKTSDGIQVGDPIPVQIGSMEYTVVGIYDADSGYSFVSGGISDQIQHQDYMLLLTIKDGMNKQETMKTILDDSGVNIYSRMNEAYLQWQGKRGPDTVQIAIAGTFLLLCAIILFTMATVIHNSFAMSVSEKMSQFGALRCVGASPAQIRKMVFQEAFLVWIIAMPLGLLLGLGAMAVVFSIVKNVNLHALRYFSLMVSPWPFVLTTMFSFVAVMLSARSPASKAARISPVEAVRGANIFEDSRSGKDRGGAILGKLFGISGQLAGKNIRRNKKRYRTTILSVTLSIAIVICVGGFGQSVIGSMLGYSGNDSLDFRITDEGPDRDIQQQRLKTLDELLMEQPGMDKSTLNLQFYTNIFIPEGNLAAEFLSSENHGSLDTRHVLENVPQNGEKGLYRSVYVYVINRLAYEQMKLQSGAPSYDQLIASKGMAVCQEADISSMDTGMKREQLADYQIGDNVNMDLQYLGKSTGDEVEDVHEVGLSFPVEAVVEETPWFCTQKGQMSLYLPEENAALVLSHQGWDLGGVNTRLCLKAKAGSEEEMSKYVQDLVSSMDQMNLYNRYEDTKEERNTAVVLSIFIYGFLAVIVLIGSLNIFNTINANLQARKRELAMTRAVGMDNRQLWSMLLLECVLYGVIGTFWGSITGLLLQMSLIKLLSEAMEVTLISPVAYILGSLVVSMAVCLLAGVSPIRRQIKRPIVEEIRAQE